MIPKLEIYLNKIELTVIVGMRECLERIDRDGIHLLQPVQIMRAQKNHDVGEAELLHPKEKTLT